MQIRRTLATLGATGTLAAGSLFLAAPAQAQPVVTGGLVNVTIVDFADVNVEDVVVQVPISVALVLCDTTVALLSDVDGDGTLDCTATATSDAQA
jgi:hypothetical protein